MHLIEQTEPPPHDPHFHAWSDRIEQDGLTPDDLLWIQKMLPEMSPNMMRLMTLLLLLDNLRLRKNA